MSGSVTSDNCSAPSIVETTREIIEPSRGDRLRRSERRASKTAPKLRRTSWRLVAMTRINRLRAMAEIVEGNGQYRNDPALAKARQLLESSYEVIKHDRESIRTRWTGALRDLVWREIHMAEAYIVSMLPDAERQRRVAEILFDARFILDRDDPVMSAAVASPIVLEGAASSPAPAEAAKPAFAYELVRRYREAWDDRYTASRGFRNRLIVLIAVVAFAVVVLIAAGSLGMVWLEASVKPTHAFLAPHLDDFLAMLTIAFLGAIGGLISGANEVVKVGGVYNPFSLPWYLLFFKIPMGALTGGSPYLTGVRGSVLVTGLVPATACGYGW